MARKNTLQAHERRTRALMTAPMAAFGVLLVALPLIYVLCTSLVTGGKFQFGMPLTLANYKALLREDYLKVFANSLQLAFFTTVISLLVGYPFGYCMARAPRKWKALLMMLVIIPFWTSALVRIYGWKILLQANGPVNGVLRSLGLIQKNIKFLGSYGSVLLAMVYCLISFMILPCHNAVDKMDFTLVEASRDLGKPRSGVPHRHAAADHAGHSRRLRAGVRAKRRPVLSVGYHGRRSGAGGQPHPRPASQGARLERRLGDEHGAHRAFRRHLSAVSQGRRR